MQGNVNIPDSTITTNLTFRQLVLMNMQQLTNFPYIEKDFDALTDYELLCLVVKFLNDVIANQNEQNDSITRMYESFLALQDYVNDTKDELEDAFNNLDNYVRNYFDNLDVQEEINNKLDQMLEDGVLTEIIQQFLQSTAIWGFDTLSDLQQATNLISGSFAKTLGYYTINDGGGCLYKITDTQSQTEYQETLPNNLYATLIIENDTINFKQLGAKNNDNTYDNKNHLLAYQTLCNNLNKQIKLIIPNGEWYFSPTHLSRIGGFNIEGIGSSSDRSFSAPKIMAINTQDYIWKFGGESNMDSTQLSYNSTCTCNKLKNLVFATGEYTVNYGGLVLEYANYGFYDNIFFSSLRGTGLYIRSSWENYFGMLSFRGIKDFTKPCLLLAEARSISGVSGNISSSSFDKLIFESISGDLIKSEIGSNFVNNQINEINVEYQYANDDETITRITNSTDLSTMTPLFLFNGNMSGVTINTINWTGLSCYHSYITVNNVSYYLKSLFNSIGGGTTESYRYDVNVGKISSRSILQILTSISPYAAAMIFSLGNYVETSNDSSVITLSRFDLAYAGIVHYDSFESRLQKINILPYNTFKLYKNTYNGNLITDANALGDKICLAKTPTGAITYIGFTYPFQYDSNNVKTKWLLRVKTDDTGKYAFVLRGTHNGENVNTTYSQSDLTANTWYEIEVEMNYDFNSQIMIVNMIGTLDTITLI